MLKNDALQCPDTKCGWSDEDYWFDTSPPREDEAERKAHHGEEYIPCLGLAAGEKPPCPDCGVPTAPWLAHYRVAAVDDRFQPFQTENGVSTSRSEFNRLKRDIESRHPGKTLTVNHQSAGGDRTSRDERRQALHNQRKKLGIDPAMLKKWDKARKAGDPVARNNSLADLARGKQAPAPPKLRDRARPETSTDH